jgi:hypothetical protein
MDERRDNDHLLARPSLAVVGKGVVIVSGESLNPFTKKESSVTVADINTRCTALE